MERSQFSPGIPLISFVLLVFISGMARADEVILKNRSRFAGKVLLDNDQKVMIKTDFGVITFKKSAVQSVQKASTNNSKHRLSNPFRNPWASRGKAADTGKRAPFVLRSSSRKWVRAKKSGKRNLNLPGKRGKTSKVLKKRTRTRSAPKDLKKNYLKKKVTPHCKIRIPTWQPPKRVIRRSG